MRSTNKNLRITSFLIIVILLNNPINAQYLRDKTKILNKNFDYPNNEKEILNLYSPNEIHTLYFDNVFSVPEIIVNFENNAFPLSLDFGSSGNITITTALAKLVQYQITDTVNTYTADGQIRGQGFHVVIPSFRVFDSCFQNEQASLMDWSIYATHPFNGMIGLKYFNKNCITLSYKAKLLAVSSTSILSKISNNNSDLITLENYSMHPYGVHFKGKVNNEVVIVYFDTGKSASFVHSGLLPSHEIATDKSGSYYQGTVEIAFGKTTFEIYYPRVKDVKRSIDSSLPVGIEVGSDILKYFLLTIDRTEKNNVLIIHK